MKTLNGKKVKITGNTTNHTFKIGQMVEIVNDGGCGAYGRPYNLVAKALDSQLQYTIGHNDFAYEFSEADINEEISKLTKQKIELDTEIKFWEDALSYMKETGVATYDEMEFKAYQVLQTINEDTSDIEKAKIIAKIVQG